MMNLQDAEAALEAIWVELPLTAEHAMFVSEKAPIFGAYSERPDNVFRAGETLLTYIEPVGYIWREIGDGHVTFGISLDFEILKPNGEVLGGQRNFLSYTATSRAKLRELMLNASLDINGLPEGDYVLGYTLRDLNSPKIAEAALPFRIVG